MKPTTDFDAQLLDNSASFDDPFFQRYSLRHAKAPLKLSETVEKNYLFPTLYADVTCAIGIFLCSYERAEALMLHRKIKPIRMTRGRSLVAFSCYEYKNVLGVAPYNEIAMTIPVMVNPQVNVPVLPMVAPLFKEFGYYVFSMPVTSLENQLRGAKIWGLPKVVQEIDIQEEGGDCVTTASTPEGETYFKLRVPTEGKPTEFDVRSNLYSRLDNQLKQSETAFKGTFNVNKFMGQLVKEGSVPPRSFLELGEGPAAQTLRSLEIEEHPFQFRFARSMTSCFDLPNQNFNPSFDF